MKLGTAKKNPYQKNPTWLSGYTIRDASPLGGSFVGQQLVLIFSEHSILRLIERNEGIYNLDGQSRKASKLVSHYLTDAELIPAYPLWYMNSEVWHPYGKTMLEESSDRYVELGNHYEYVKNSYTSEKTERGVLDYSSAYNDYRFLHPNQIPLQNREEIAGTFLADTDIGRFVIDLVPPESTTEVNVSRAYLYGVNPEPLLPLFDNPDVRWGTVVTTFPPNSSKRFGTAINRCREQLTKIKQLDDKQTYPPKAAIAAQRKEAVRLLGHYQQEAKKFFEPEGV